MKWDEEACRAAQYAQDSLYFDRFGAMQWRSQTAIFGNSGFLCDDHVQKELSTLRERLRAARFEELGFGISHDRYSWALMVSPLDLRRLEGEVLRPWLRQCHIRVDEMSLENPPAFSAEE